MNLWKPIVLSLVLGLAGCASIGDEDNQVLPSYLADQVIKVEDKHRALRVCLMAVGVAEVMTDRVQLFDGKSAPEALGRMIALQGSVDTAELASPMWMNTDMTDVAHQLAAVLKEAGQEKLGRILAGGPTLFNFLDVTKRAMVLVAKGDALLLDINNMLTGINIGQYEELQVWQACEGRMYKNKTVLSILSGVQP